LVKILRIKSLMRRSGAPNMKKVLLLKIKS
jgi:hypothetical protein